MSSGLCIKDPLSLPAFLHCATFSDFSPPFDALAISCVLTGRFYDRDKVSSGFPLARGVYSSCSQSSDPAAQDLAVLILRIWS